MLASIYISLLIFHSFIVVGMSMSMGYIDNLKYFTKFLFVSNFFISAFGVSIIYLIVYLIDKYTKLKFLLITLGICTLITIWFSFNMLSVPPSVPGF